MAMDVPSAHLEQNNQPDDTIDDDWWEDGSDASELNRERKARENEFHKMGYRDGVIAGKEVSAQEGFNVGFKQAVLVGYNWGVVRGVTSAMASLPSLKDKLTATKESKDRLERLHERVQSISSHDALKMFHDSMLSSGLEQPHKQPEENCPIEVSADEAAGGSAQLGNYFRELKSLTSEFCDIRFH